jgi:5'-deoxynucleotidase YfbR-like HD superfamily hydrolase
VRLRGKTDARKRAPLKRWGILCWSTCCNAYASLSEPTISREEPFFERRGSYLLQDWEQFLAVETPYAQVSKTMARILGFDQSVNSLERGNRKMSAAVEAFWANQTPPPADEEGQMT